uniref:Uncharacterized protein n=1 Tax=Paramormyrops kingsleyae TaxID=1676925 RepID=A0A3B3S737_9TELE
MCSSRTLLKPSMRPVGLPCASCVWKTNRGRRLAGGGGSPAPFAEGLAAELPTSSFSTKLELSRDLLFFFLSPNGILFIFRS